MSTKKIKISSLIVLLLLFSLLVKAQNNPIIVQTILSPPYPVYFTDITENSNFANIIIQNTDLNNEYYLRFRIKLDGQNGITLTIPESVNPNNPLKIKAGETKTLFSQDLINVYDGIKEKDIIYEGIKIRDVYQSQRIPDGFYNICIQAFDNETMKPLSGENPLGCSNKMILTTLEPPIITSPSNNTDIIENNPQHVLFQWTAVAGATSPILYDVKIAKLENGVSAYEAIQSDNFLYYEIENYAATVFSYGPSLPQLTPNAQYAIQITAHGINDEARIRNEGKSDVVVFNYMPQQTTKNLSFPCNGNCDPLPIITNTTDIINLEVGETIDIGHFSVILTEVTKIGDSYRGKGLLNPTSFFLFPIWVEFDNIKVNTAYEVYEGQINAIQKDELAEADIFDHNANNDPDDMYDVITNPNVTEDYNPATDAGSKLPYGYGNEDRRLFVVGIQLTPQSSEINIVGTFKMAGDFRNGEAEFLLGAEGVCVTPGGPAIGRKLTHIDLLNEVEYFPNENYTILFEAGINNSNNGCFATIDCDGISNLKLGGLVIFSRNLLLPENENSDVIDNKSLAGRFNVITDNSDSWVAEVNFSGTTDLTDVVISPNFRMTDMNNYSFTVEKMYVDQSEIINPEDMAFPTGYTDPGESWKGVYIKNFDMLLPNYFKKGDNQRIEIEGYNLVYEDDGVSFDATGNDLVTEDDPGKFGEWDFTLRTLNFNMLRNDIQTANMTGKLKIDFISSYVSYDLTTDFVNGNPEYTIGIETEQELAVDIWDATMNLDTTSRIDATVIDDDIDLVAVLSGNINFNDKIGDVQGVTLTGINFENLKILTHSPYVENGIFEVDDNIDQSFGDFTVEVENVTLEDYNGNIGSGSGTRKALGMDLNMEFGAEGCGFSAGSRVSVIAKKSNEQYGWGYDGIDVGIINLHGEVSSVSVDGKLEWYNNDQKYGNGYRGEVEAKYFGFTSFKLDAEMLFGAKNNVDYWYVDGSVLWSVVHGIVPPFGFIGFGGGAYYNLRPDNEYESLDTTRGARSYHVSQDYWGFNGRVLANTEPENIISGEARLTGSFHNNTLEMLTLKGEFGMFREPRLNANSSSEDMIRLLGDFTINNTPGNRSVSARLGYDINIPKNPSFIWGTNTNDAFLFEAGENGWKLWLGNPGEDKMLDLNIGFRYYIWGKKLGLSVGTKSYFDIGSELPEPPSLPDEVAGELGRNNMESGEGASGIMAGFHTKFDMDRCRALTIWGNGITFEADAGFGIDMALRNYNFSTCNGSTEFGINRWRADARGYLWANADLKGEIMYHSFDILELGIYALLHYIGPNPSYFNARLTGKIGLPVYGDYRFTTHFTMGETCEYGVDSASIANLALEGLLDNISLNKTADSLYPYDRGLRANVELKKEAGGVQEYEMADNSILKTKVVYIAKLLRLENDGNYTEVSSLPFEFPYTMPDWQNRDGTTKITGTKEIIYIWMKDWENGPLLRPETDYRVEITAKLLYGFDEEPNKILEKPDGTEAKETLHVDFITSKVEEMKIRNVVSAMPYENQRFFYIGDYAKSKSLHLTFSNEHLFDRFDDDIEIKIEFEDLVTGDVFESYTDVSRNAKTINYSLPTTSLGNPLHLSNAPSIIAIERNRIYKVTFYTREWSNVNIKKYKEIYTFCFRTSAYNKFIDKLNDIEISVSETQNRDNPTSKKHILNISAKEGFGINEPILLTYNGIFINSSRDTYSVNRRNDIEYLRENNVNYSLPNPEFTRNYSEYPELGNLTSGDIYRARIAGARGELPVETGQLEKTVTAQVNWNVDEYGYSLHNFVSFIHLIAGLEITPYTTSSYGIARLTINGQLDINVQLFTVPNYQNPNNPLNNNIMNPQINR